MPLLLCAVLTRSPPLSTAAGGKEGSDQPHLPSLKTPGARLTGMLCSPPRSAGGGGCCLPASTVSARARSGLLLLVWQTGSVCLRCPPGGEENEKEGRQSWEVSVWAPRSPRTRSEPGTGDSVGERVNG